MTKVKTSNTSGVGQVEMNCPDDRTGVGVIVLLTSIIFISPGLSFPCGVKPRLPCCYMPLSVSHCYLISLSKR